MDIFEKAEELSDTITESDFYKKYIKTKEKLKENPELLERVQEYRRRNFALQNGTSNNKIDELRELENEYSEMFKNTLVRDYLNTELVLCRNIQHINEIIVDKMDFKMDFLKI